MRTLVKLTGSELKLFLREPLGVFFVVAFPSILVGILGSIPGFREPTPDLGGLRVIDLYVTISITLGLAILALQGAPVVLATYRERGVLRRLSTTPVHPAKLLVAQLTSNLVAFSASTVLVLAVGRIVFDVPLPRHLGAYVVAFALATSALFAMGVFVAAIAPNGKAGNAIGTILFFPVMFFAGLYVPREAMPETLRRIGDFTPLGAGEQALRDASTGLWPHAGQIAVLGAYIVVFGLAAARLFRWE
ncbi:MAG TPA: ABC transporter permease [Pilimelia sp.]|nr:ABC transporter permease [Pilimelia sp.]